MSNNECKEYLELIGAYLDNELSADETRRVREHIEKCRDCSREFDQLKELDNFVKTDVIEDPGTDFWRDQRESIRAEIEGRSQTANIKPLIREAAESESRSSNIKWSRIISVAAASVIVLVLFNEIDRFKTPVDPGSQQMQIATQNNEDEKTVQEESVPINIDVPERAESTEVLAARTDNEIKTTEQPGSENRPEQETFEEQPPVKTVLREAQPMRQPSVIISGATQANVFDAIAAKFEEYEELEELARVTRQRRINSYDENTYYRVVGLQAGDVRLVLPTERNKPGNAEEEYQGYLDNKQFISGLEDPIDKKNCWLKYLAVVEENMVFELILEDVYNLYGQIVSINSPSNLKKEAFDFVAGFKAFLVKSHGENIVEDKIDYFRQIQQ